MKYKVRFITKSNNTIMGVVDTNLDILAYMDEIKRCKWYIFNDPGSGAVTVVNMENVEFFKIELA